MHWKPRGKPPSAIVFTILSQLDETAKIHGMPRAALVSGRHRLVNDPADQMLSSAALLADLCEGAAVFAATVFPPRLGGHCPQPPALIPL